MRPPSSTTFQRCARLLHDRLAPLLPEGPNQDEAESRRRKARTSLADFTTYTMPEYVMNWHHRVLFRYLQAWVDGTITRLMVFMPPQTGKSEAVSRRLPAYLLGRFPDSKVMACSHTDTLASLMNRDVQRVIDGDSYRELFPGTRLSDKNIRTQAYGRFLRNADIFEIVERKGSYRAAGVGSAITGLPFHFGIIDDIFKDDEEANSPAIREKIWNWYITTFSSRKTDARARILITLTRWHQDDLPGRLIDLAGKNPKADQWVVVRFPALLEDESQREEGDPRSVGDSLWEERHPRTEYETDRIQCGPVKWSAVYQQRPTPAAGVVFRKDQFRYFGTRWHGGKLQVVLHPPPRAEPGVDGEAPPEPVAYDVQDCVFFQTADAADTAKPGSAYTCVVTFCRTPAGDLLVWHVWRARLEYPERYAAVQAVRVGLGVWDRMTRAWSKLAPVLPWPVHPSFCGMEAKASGLAMIQTAASEGRPLLPLHTGALSKTQRCAAVSVLYHNGKVYHHAGAAWLTTFEAELLAFPSGTYADQVDCLAYGGILSSRSPMLAGAGAGADCLFDPANAHAPGGNGTMPLHKAQQPRDGLVGEVTEAQSFLVGDSVITFED